MVNSSLIRPVDSVSSSDTASRMLLKPSKPIRSDSLSPNKGQTNVTNPLISGQKSAEKCSEILSK